LILIPGYAQATGSFVDDHETAEDIDIVVKSANGESGLEETLMKFNRAVPSEWRAVTHLVPNPKGAFFCEVAAALDVVLDGPGGYPLEPDWWQREPEDFRDQVERYCRHCGMAVPIEREPITTEHEKISVSNMFLFQSHNLRGVEDMEVFYDTLTIEEMEAIRPTWDPGNYRGDIRKDRAHGYAVKQEHRK